MSGHFPSFSHPVKGNPERIEKGLRAGFALS
jgi:hypothetical protein